MVNTDPKIEKVSPKKKVVRFELVEKKRTLAPVAQQQQVERRREISEKEMKGLGPIMSRRIGRRVALF